jgi:hypothetical protein
MQKNSSSDFGTSLKNFQINIRTEKVLSALKFRQKKDELDKNFQIYILKEIQKAYPLIETVAVYKIEDKSNLEYLYSESNDVKKLLSESSKVVVFAVSIGSKIEEKIERFLNNSDAKNIMEASVLDAIGSEAVEQCANYTNELIKKQVLLEDYFPTTRYSAGYGDWDVKQNFDIFKILNLDSFGIKINEAGLFYPQKTITAIFGLKKRFR